MPDDQDNCPLIENADQIDLDEDGIGDACDNDIAITPVYSCEGFGAPVSDRIVKVKKNRVIPFKAKLLGDNDQYVDDFVISAAPVVQVSYEGGESDAEDVAIDALSAGQKTNGN